MAVVLLAVLVVLLGLWMWARREGDRVQLPEGDVIYRDTEKGVVETPLYSDRYGLVGRPDYLLRTAEGLVVVELKKSRCPRSGPYESHLREAVGNQRGAFS